MSQSPLSDSQTEGQDDYFRAWDALGAMIARGRSFSGHERNCCFLNTGGQRFADVSAATGLDLDHDGRGVAPVDWDHDGDLDLWITSRTAPRVRLLRNDLPRQNHFLALRLEGRTCNRDAIGARVEVYPAGSSGSPLIRTLRAGDSFLSQSTKWLHFGLGSAQRIEKVIVRWPGSREVQSFPIGQVDRHYRLVQGSDRAVPLDPSSPQVALRPATPQVPDSTRVARVLLTHRRRAPAVEYRALSGEDASGSEGTPTLLTLWASWCRPCLAELNQFAKRDAAFQSRGVRIVALCVDDLESSPRGELTAARTYLENARLPFPTGIASRELVRELTVLHNRAIYLERPLPLPSSFLIDSRGMVAAIYKGPVGGEQLLADLELLDADPAKVLVEALPFAGRSAIGRFDYSGLGFARAYWQGGYLDDARRELQKILAPPSNSATPASSDRERRTAHARAYHMLGQIDQEQGQYAAAAKSFAALVQLLPEQAAPRVAWALALYRQDQSRAPQNEVVDFRRADTAVEKLRKAVQLHPQDADTLRTVARGYLAIGRHAEALELLQRARKLAPERVEVAFDLALALQSDGQFAAAVRTYDALLKQHSDTYDAANNLAWLLATCRDEAVRDGPRAVALAERLHQSTGGKSAAVLDTLSAAYARVNRFQNAAQTAAEGARLARASGQSDLHAQLVARLRSYQSGKPFTDTDSDRP